MQSVEKIVTKGSRLCNQINFEKGLGGLSLNSDVVCYGMVSLKKLVAAHECCLDAIIYK